MNNLLQSVVKNRRFAIAAVTVAAVPFATGTASAATHSRAHHATHATPGIVAATTSVATAAAAPAPATAATTAAPSVTSVISIGGYTFYNLTYAEAVDAWQNAVATAPAGYTPPPVYSVSVEQTVSGTVEDPNG